MADTQTKPARIPPMKDTFTEAYWNATKEGRLVVQRSVATGKLQWPPRPRMLPLWDEEVEWTEIKGDGTIYSFSIIHRSSHAFPPVPYVIAIVELEGGVFFTTNIVDIDPNKVHIGMKVHVKFEKQTDDIFLPVFAPVGG